MAVETLLSRLKSIQPVKVRVWTGDESRDVGVPTRRRKWAAVIECIEQLGWTRCELLDRSGSTLAIVDNDGAAVELETIGAGGGKLTELRALGELMLKAQVEALRFRDAETKTMLGAMTDVLKSISTANSELAKIFRMATQAVGMGASAMADARNAGDDGRRDDDPMAQLAVRMLLGKDDAVPVVEGRPPGQRPNGKRPPRKDAE